MKLKLSFINLLIPLLIFSQNFERRMNIHPHDWANPKIIDFDNDGLKDVVSVSIGGEIAWWKNNNSSNYTKTVIDYLYNKNWKNLDVIDIDGDGDLDILLAERHSLAIYYNDSNGNFTAENISGVSSQYTNIIGGDFDNDGLIDFITTSRASNGNIIFWKNMGDTTQYHHGFNPINIKQASIEKGDIQVDDLDNDGDLDLIYSILWGYSGNSIICLLNDGIANFNEHTINYNRSNQGIKISDFDGDGDKDFAVIQSYQKIILFTNQGNLNFIQSEISNIDDLEAIAIVDYDNDGDKDFVFSTTPPFSDSTFGILENTGNANYNLHTIESLGKVDYIDYSDFNNDGSMDFLVTSKGFDDPIIYIKNNTNYNKIILDDFFMDPDKFISVDIDNDGLTDILNLSTNKNELILWHNQGNYNFDKIIIDDSLPPRSHFVNIDTGDFNNNEYNDILVSTTQESWHGKMILYTNNGNLNFTKSFLSNACASASFFTDIDLDGDMDIIYSLNAINGRIVCFRNDGNGNLQSVILVNHIDYTDCTGFKDVDNDGLNDLVTDKDVFFKNNGSLNFTAVQLPALAGNWFDMDNDGDLDILGGASVSTGASNILSWWENDGNNNFTEHQIQTNILTSGFTINDFDGDGDIDFICSSGSYYTTQLTLWTNDGNMQFTPSTIDPNSSYFVWHAISNDFDGDGDIDLLSSSTRFPFALWDNLSNNTVEYNISANVNPNNSGNVSGVGNYTYGQSVNLTATAQQGYYFINWTENGHPVSALANYSFTATSNRILTANFTSSSQIELVKKEEFLLMPNPTNKILNIENPNNYKIKQAKIYNLQGQQILKFNDNFEHLDVSNLPKGMYILELQTEEKENKARFKFIKE